MFRNFCGAHPWLEQSLAALARYAQQRDTERFSKEAYFSSRRLRTRLVDPDEVTTDYTVLREVGRSSFLRRKVEQGKRMEGEDESR